MSTPPKKRAVAFRAPMHAWVFCLLACASFLRAQTPSLDPPKLLDRLAGNWVLQGTIAGSQTTHDVEAHWALRHEYLQLHEVSREKEPGGEPAYEAIVLISWDPKENQYACLWLDSTAGGALASTVTCRAAPAGNSIPFLFTLSPTESIHTTFSYRQASDTWQWTIDDVANGKTGRFADVTLSRKK
jgi:hypothetical protein